MGMYFTIAVRNLFQARRRTMLIGSALVMVTTLLVLLLSLSRGLTETMVRSATTLTTGHVNVAGWYKGKPSDGGPIISDTPNATLIIVSHDATPRCCIFFRAIWNRFMRTLPRAESDRAD